MQVEQRPPNKPKFLLVLILFCVSLLVIFIIALIFVHGDWRHLGLQHHSSHPTSQLVLPHSPTDQRIALT